MRERLEVEAKELNYIGNKLIILNTEVGKPPIAESAQLIISFTACSR